MKDPTQTVEVNLGERSYAIEIVDEILSAAGRFIFQRGPVSHAIVITDQNVEKPHGDRVAQEIVDQTTAAVDLLAVEPGEASKSIETAAALWGELLDFGADRKSVIVAVGGGVVGDLAGFVAATYARGIGYFQVPTSLLAQVDSSVGGKVGINLPEAKNMIGAFLQPRGVLIDTATLDTLPEREYRSGLGEVVKYGVILDAELFDFLEANAAALVGRDRGTLRHIIARCCRLKADVVEKDEREETGLRAILNYGHTFAHALESLTGYGTLLHGEAVAIGMLCASRLAERIGRVDASVVTRQRDLAIALGLPIGLPRLDPEEVLCAMMHDKKVEHGRLRFVLPSRIGQAEIVAGIGADTIRASLDDSV